MIQDGVPFDPHPRSRSWSYESCEHSRFQSLSSAGLYSKKISKFCPDKFLIFILVWRHVTFKVRASHGVDRQCRMRLIV